MRKNVAHFLPDAEFGISHGTALSLRLSHFRLHNQVEAAALAEDFLEDMDQLLLAFFCDNGVDQDEVHFIDLRKGDLRGGKQVVQKNAVVFQFQQNTRTVHLQKVFRRILA